jgi:hypothetical protein
MLISGADAHAMNSFFISSNRNGELRAKTNEETPEARELRLSTVRERYAERKCKKTKKKIS